MQHFSGSPNGASQIAPLLTCSASQIAPPLTWGASEIAPPCYTYQDLSHYFEKNILSSFDEIP